MSYKATIYFDAYVDDYEQGQELQSVNYWTDTIEKDTTEELKKAICEATYSKWDDITYEDINEYPQASEYWTSYLADEDNQGDASASQVEQWKQGKLTLYAINCHILVSEVIEKKAVL